MTKNINKILFFKHVLPLCVLAVIYRYFSNSNDIVLVYELMLKTIFFVFHIDIKDILDCLTFYHDVQNIHK